MSHNVATATATTAAQTQSAPPTPAAQSAQQTPAEITVSMMVRSFDAAGVLRAEDRKPGAAGMNKRLGEAGYLTGEPGNWSVTAAGEAIGIHCALRSNAEGTWNVILYPPAAQSTIQQLYTAGRI